MNFKKKVVQKEMFKLLDFKRRKNVHNDTIQNNFSLEASKYP